MIVSIVGTGFLSGIVRNCCPGRYCEGMLIE